MSQLFSQHWKDYELLDAGGNKKLERWGKVLTIRPERNAYFRSVRPHEVWKAQADFEFVEESNTKGHWQQLNPNAPKEWVMAYNNIQLNLRLTGFKHLGLFPEQQANWDFIEKNTQTGERFLNLFGYTGVASLVARAKGADVFHCDSVKQIITWGKENMETSGLADIHWVLEDALKFAQREVKRGKKYKGIIMDPPAFGIGAKNERWKIEDKFPELLELALNLRAENGFIIVNTYSPRLEENAILDTFNSMWTERSRSSRGIERSRSSHGSERNRPKPKITVGTLCLRSTTDKVIEYGLRTLITD